MNDFNDLFDAFFGSGNTNNDSSDSKSDRSKKLIDIINSINRLGPKDPSDEEASGLNHELEENLGEPDKVEYYIEDDMFFEKKTWEREEGKIIKTIMSDEPFDAQDHIVIPTEPLFKELSLDEQMTFAIECENYELAAEIRDRIKKETAKAKRLAKKNDNK
jgi:hypothetical protein